MFFSPLPSSVDSKNIIVAVAKYTFDLEDSFETVVSDNEFTGAGSAFS